MITTSETPISRPASRRLGATATGAPTGGPVSPWGSTSRASRSADAGTSTSRSPAARKSGTSKPGARRSTDGTPSLSRRPWTSSASDWFCARATLTRPPCSSIRVLVILSSFWWVYRRRDHCVSSRGHFPPGDPPRADQKRQQHPEGEPGGGVRPLGGAEHLLRQRAESETRVQPRGDVGEGGQRGDSAPRDRYGEERDDGGCRGEKDHAEGDTRDHPGDEVDGRLADQRRDIGP